MSRSKNLNPSPPSKSCGIQGCAFFSPLVPPGYPHVGRTDRGCQGLWRTLVRVPLPGHLLQRERMTKNEKELVDKVRNLRIDLNPPEEWISLSIEKELFFTAHKASRLPAAASRAYWKQGS